MCPVQLLLQTCVEGTGDLGTQACWQVEVGCEAGAQAGGEAEGCQIDLDAKKGASEHCISSLCRPSGKHTVFCSYKSGIFPPIQSQFLRGRTLKVRLQGPHHTRPRAAAPQS